MTGCCRSDLDVVLVKSSVKGRVEKHGGDIGNKTIFERE